MGSRRQLKVEDFIKHAHFTKTLKVHTDREPWIHPGVMCPNLTNLELKLELLPDRERPQPLETASRKEKLLHKQQLLVQKQQEQDRIDQCAVEFLKQHKSKLTTFTYHSTTSKPILDAIQELPSTVKALHLQDLVCDSMTDWVSRFNSISQMEVLTLHGPSLKGRTQPDDIATDTLRIQELKNACATISPSEHTQLQKLVLITSVHDHLMSQAQFELVQRSPRLVSLQWKIQNPRANAGRSSTAAYETTLGCQINLMARSIFEQGKNGNPCPWSNLKDLTFSGLSLDNNDLKILIQSLMPTLRELTLTTTSFDHQTWQALRTVTPFLTTLRSLNLKNCLRLSGGTIHDILCTMSGLEVFKADVIQDADLNSRPWVCQGLRELHVGFILYKNTEEKEMDEEDDEDDEDDYGDGEDPVDRYYRRQKEKEKMKKYDSYYEEEDEGKTIEPEILGRLSKLTKLEYLNLTLPHYREPDYPKKGIRDPQENLYLTLELGLDQLKTLTKLRVLELPEHRDMVWSGDEAEWALEHWPRLELILGHPWMSSVVDVLGYDKSGISW